MSEAAAPPFEPAASRRRTWLYALKMLLVGLAAVLVWRLLHGIEWAELDARLATARGDLLALAVALLAARTAAWALRWGAALRRAGGRPRGWVTFAATAGAMAINHVTPGARVLGGLFRARWIARRERGGRLGTLGACFGTVFFDQLNHQAVTAAATVVALVAGLAVLGRPGPAAVLALLVIATGAAVVAWVRRLGNGAVEAVLGYLGRRIAQAQGLRQRFFASTREAVEVVRLLLGDGALWARTLALGGLFVAANVAAQWAVFAALGQAPAPFTVFLGVSLGATAGLLLGTPGGAGATEATMVACYVALGMGRLDATAGVLLYRGLHYAVILALGVPGVAVLELGGGGGRRSSSA